jgi:hypothetical protein
MNELDWESRWRGGDTPWDAGSSAPTLTAMLAAGAVPEGRALVPGCGAGHDVLAFAGSGRPALGLEVAASAIERFERLRDDAGLHSDVADVILADYFNYEPARPFDLMWDYTFLCAIDPEQRPAWAKRAAELLRPGGELITLIFPVNEPPGMLGPGPHEGPPYPLDPVAVRELVAPWFTQRSLEPAAHSHPKRAGREWVGRWGRR